MGDLVVREPDGPAESGRARAEAAIDDAAAEDPRRVVVRGEAIPKDLAQGQLASAWVRRLRPEAGDALLLAARAHHLGRWRWPRETFPDGRAGYLRWRRQLYDRHAQLLEEILRANGIDDATIDAATGLVRKQGLAAAAAGDDVQVLEDAVCLVFLETDFADLAARTEIAKMVVIVEKTLAKMSPAAHALISEVPGATEVLARLGLG